MNILHIPSRGKNFAIKKIQISAEIIKKHGVKEYLKATKNYIKLRYSRRKNTLSHVKQKSVLFISGCYIEAPNRYRCYYQMEALQSNGFSCDYVWYELFDPKSIDFYDVIYLYRLPLFSNIEEGVKRAKKQNKLVVYDTDDLVFDRKYTEGKYEVEAMSKEEKKIYYDGIDGMQRMLKMADIATTSTDILAKELQNHVKDVYVSRNSFDKSLLKLSEKAFGKKEEHKDVIIGYFSGTATHNKDFEMIQDALLHILQKYENTKLMIVGPLDLSETFNTFDNRIIKKTFVPYQDLPELIAEADINLAPLTDTLFNNAKSEIKFTEAALVRVPSVVSARDAFLHIVRDGENGFIADSQSEWEEKISQLVESKDLREKIAENAYTDVLKEYSTKNIGNGLVQFLKQYMAPKVGYIIPTNQISGGSIVVVKHVNELQKRGYNTVLITHDENDKNVIEWFPNQNVPIVPGRSLEHSSAKYDVLIATLWTTVDQVRKYPYTKRKLYLVQNKEQFFYEPGTYTFAAAEATYFFEDIEYITISKWCEEWLTQEYFKKVDYLPNGLDHNLFYPEQTENLHAKKRILIEGNSTDKYKNVDEAFKIINKLDEDVDVWYVSYGGDKKEWYKVDKSFNKVPLAKMKDLYSKCDILLKTSMLESFSYPPLEMMACGGVCVVAENSGNKEYVKNEYNALTYKVNDIDAGVAQLKRALNDDKLCETLRENGFKTAQERNWDVVVDQLEDILDLRDKLQK